MTSTIKNLKTSLNLASIDQAQVSGISHSPTRFCEFNQIEEVKEVLEEYTYRSFNPTDASQKEFKTLK
jgi:hypothetical protein